jgi:hypothetical protein
MVAQTLQHSPSYNFQHSSPLETLVRKTSSRRAQGPSKSLGQQSSGQFLRDPYLLSPAYASHTPPRQQQQPPNSPLLHTHFRGSTLSAVTNDHNSYLDTSMAFSGGENSQEVEYAYRDDDASVYSTPSMLPSPHPQDRWSPIDSHLDHEHEPTSEPWDDSEAYTGTTTHSRFAPQDTNDTSSESVFEAVIESSLPVVVVSPVLDPGPPTPALQPTRGGKVPIAAPAKFNFSRPGRPPILPPSDLKREVIERNAGRYPAESLPSLSINIPLQGMTPGSPPPSSPDGMTKSAPPQDLTQPSTHPSLRSPSDFRSLRNIGYDLPPLNSHGPHLKNAPRPRNPTSTSEIDGSELPRNLTLSSSSSTTMSNQQPLSPQQYSGPLGPISSDDHPTSRLLVPSGSSQLLGPDAHLRTSPLHQRSARAQGSSEPVLPRSMDVFVSKSSLLPDSSIPPTSSSASNATSSPRDSQSGSLKDMDDPSSSEHSSHRDKQQFSHWSMDGASILELPPNIVDRDTASPTLSWKWGKKRNKLRKVKKDGNGYEIDGNVSDANKKDGKQKAKEIVILWPEPDSRGQEQLHNSPSEGQSRDIKPSLLAADSPAQNFSRPDVVINDQGSWRSRGLNTRESPSWLLSSPSTGSQQSHHLPESTPLDVRLNPTVSQSINFHSMFQPHSHGPLSSPGPFPAPQPLEAVSSNGPWSANIVGAQQFQRPPPISLDDSSSSFWSTHPYSPHSMFAQGSTSPLSNLHPGLQQLQQPSGPISLKDSPWAGHSPNTNSYGPPLISRSPAPSGAQQPENFTDDSPRTSHSLDANPYNPSSTSSVPRSPNLNVNGSPLHDHSDYSTASPEAPSRPSTDTITGSQRPTIELPKAPPPRTVSPATSVYSQYSFYQLDSASASLTNRSTRDSPDSHSSSNSWPQDEPRPPLLSPHYTPPTRSPTADFRSPSPAYTIPPRTSSHSPHEYLQLGIQHHEANRLKDAAICFEKSAKDDGGCGVGMVMWGLTLRHGWGCEKNEALGFKWLQKAAESAVTDLEGSRKGLDTSAVQVCHNLRNMRQGDSR